MLKANSKTMGFFFQAEDGIRDDLVTGVQTCALPIWLRACEDRRWRLIVVDDGSGDGTEQVLRRQAAHPRLRAYRHRMNRGYGNALKTGLFHAETPYAVTMDADGQHQLEDVARLLEAMQTQDADLVIGARL